MRETASEIVVQVGETRWHVARSGAALVSSVKYGDRTVVENLRLVARRQDAASSEETATLTTTRYTSRVDTVVIEQRGPNRRAGTTCRRRIAG